VKLESLSELFARLTFEIPDYQRGYAWELKNVEEFWDDINRIGIANPQHFTGTLILEMVEDGSPGSIVVDGQQRLTTAVLLLAALIEKLTEIGNVVDYERLRQQYLGSVMRPKFRYNLSQDSWAYLALNIFKDSSFAARAADHVSTYTQNLDTALLFFRKCLKDIEKVRLLQIVECLEHKLLFNVLEVNPKSFNIHVAFESINHRGRNLTTLELLKNRLIYIISILKLPETEQSEVEITKANLRSRVNNAWRDIYSWLGKAGVKSLDEDEFLRAHSRVYFHVASAEAKWLDTLLFNEEFSGQRALEGKISATYITKYLSSLSLGAMIWSHLQSPRNLPQNQLKWLSRINRTRKPLFDPLLLASYLRVLEDNHRAQSNLQRTDGVDATLINLMKQIERFNVLVFLVSQRRSHTGTKEFYRLAHDLYARKNKMAGDTDAAIEYMSRYIEASILNTKMLPNGDYYYINSEFEIDGWLDIGNFSREIRRALKSGEGYYKMTFTTCLLFEYEEALRLKGHNDPKVNWETIANSIEHIYPQDDEHWSTLTRSIGNQRSKYKINSYLHSLGNLLLLNGSRNSQLGKMPYRKQDMPADLSTSRKAKRERYKEGSFSENEVAINNVNWTKQSILKRGEELLKFAENRWDFKWFSEEVPDYKHLLILDSPKL
jgi:hypothetical protein